MASVFFVLGCGNSGTNKPAVNTQNAAVDQYETLEIRYQGSPGMVQPFELAEDLGYLEPLKLVYVGSGGGGPQSLQTLQTNQIDLGGSHMTGIINLLASEADPANGKLISIIGSLGSDEKTTTGLYALESSGIRTPRDLIGKIIGLNSFGAASEAFIKKYLTNGGLSPAEIEQVQLVLVPAMNAEQALRSKQIHGATLNGQTKEKAVAGGGLWELSTDVATFGPTVSNISTVTKEFAKNNPNTTRKLVEGIATAIEWSKNNPLDVVVARLRNIMEKRNREEDPAVMNYWKGFGIASEGGLMSEQDAQLWIDWLVTLGNVKEGQIKPAHLFTNEYNPYYKGK
ncbi:ABC transporter substrate-binding protein [Treponema primitia]|nr:ABC transporter substrate-binding protein [Treponema primitia]